MLVDDPNVLKQHAQSCFRTRATFSRLSRTTPPACTTCQTRRRCVALSREPLASYNVSFASCGPCEPQTTGHHVPHDGGCALTRHLLECGRQTRRRASSKRIYFPTGCSGRHRVPKLDSTFVVIWIMICSCIKPLQWFCCVIICNSNMCVKK